MFDHLKLYEVWDRRHELPAEWERHKQEIIRQAKQARARELSSLFVRPLSAARAVSARLAASYATWRARRRAVRELHALGDRTLKDLGIHRSEIESVVYGRTLSRITEGRIAARAFELQRAQRNRKVRPAPEPACKSAA